jgi:hypothetical protein
MEMTGERILTIQAGIMLVGIILTIAIASISINKK